MKSKKIALQLPLSIVMLAIVVVGCFAITYFSGVKPIFYLLLIPVMFLTVQITALFHEFGHYIATKNSGFEVYYFKFSCFTVDKYGRKRFRISLFNKHLGEMRFFPKEEGRYSQKLEHSLNGGLVGNFLVAVILNLCLALSLIGFFAGVSSPYLCVVFSFSPYAIYAYAINAIAWFHPLNDGAQIKRLKTNEDERQAVDNLYAIQKQLFEGKTYGEIPKGYFNFGVNASEELRIFLTVYSFRRAIECEDLPTASALAGVLDGRNFSDEEIFYELLYWYILEGNEQKIAEYSSILSFSASSDEPIVFRAMLAHAKYRNDENYVNVAKPTAIKICNEVKLNKGDALYNLKLIERL